MHDYSVLKKLHGNRVSQTIDTPIMIMDFWDLSDAFLALFVVLVFGVIFYSWALMLVLLIFTLGVVPMIKGRHNRGIFFHWPYKHFHVALPGLINPKGRRKYSD